MYTDIKTILDDAVKNKYAVLACSGINLETLRGMIAAADAEQAPLIILMGQAQITKHASPELMIPMIKTLAEKNKCSYCYITRPWTRLG